MFNNAYRQMLLNVSNFLSSNLFLNIFRDHWTENGHVASPSSLKDNTNKEMK